ncbi:hypothetical protein D9M71_134650 [compost metagenome]
MPRYYIHFKAMRQQESASEHIRTINTEYPIEYDSDIIDVQEWAAKEVQADSAMLLSWRELKGAERPQGD